MYSETTSDTVENATNLLDCISAQIAKTMTFIIKNEIIAIVTSETAKIDNAKYKSMFGIKTKMIPFNNVEELTGHIPGGVGPFALKENVKVY